MDNTQRKFSDLEYIKEACNKYSYPEGTFDALEKAYNIIIENQEASDVFFGWLCAYERDKANDEEMRKTMLDDTADAAQKCGVSEYTVHLLLLILMTPHLLKLYKLRGIDENMIDGVFMDLKWKLLECLRMHDIFGTFVASWHLRFYRLNLFSLGRLQFEIKKAGFTYSLCGVDIEPETTVLGVHIPSSGRLVREEYLESYARAEKFFAHLFPNGKTIFTCSSWLLFPEHKVMLPETSGIRIFAEDFSVYEAYYSKPLSRPWPIFYNKKNAPADELPTDTTLERLYTERYKKGLPSGSALGVIIYKDGQILNTEKDKMV